MSGLPPEDPHGYAYGTVFALGMIAGGLIAAATYLIAGVLWR